MRRPLVLFSCFVLVGCGATPEAHALPLPGHRVLLQGEGRLVILDRQGQVEWEMPWGGIHDVQRLADGHLLVQQGGSKLVEIDPQRREVVWSYDAATANGNAGKRVEVHSFQPLPDGHVLIAESGPGRLIEIDRQGQLLREVKMHVLRPDAHRDTRLVRRLANGNVLVCHEGDGCVREYDWGSGEVVWQFEVPLFGQEPRGEHGPESFGNAVFGALRLPTGNTLVATGNGHSVLEVDPQGQIVWTLRQRDLPGIVLAWVTTLEVLANGNYVIGNCHAGPGQPVLIEIEPRSKRVVWQIDAFERFGNSVSNSMLLDEVTLR